jgi:hypothetical protein
MATTVRGKTRIQCPRCKSAVLRVVWDREAGQTVRRFVCPTLGCPYTSDPQRLDRLVRSLIAPHDAAFLNDLLSCAQAVCDAASTPGHDAIMRHYITELQSRINRLPAGLVAKLREESR